MVRKRGKTVRPVSHLDGKTHRKIDKRIHPAALPPGIRISKSGKKYGEYRANRADLSRRKRL